MDQVLKQIVSHPFLHAKWLNTLSYMENCGARKIAGCEHPTMVKEEMLKHAAEEFRHAYYLKQQINKIYDGNLETYHLKNMLGGFKSIHYLQMLDVMTSRYLLQEVNIPEKDLKRVSYLLVTYAIEMRAGELYPLYHQILKDLHSKVHVKSIVLEEEEHLNDMKREIDLMDNGAKLSNRVCEFEATLNQAWQETIKNEVEIETERGVPVCFK